MKKFRDQKTGKVFHSIEAAISYFRCPGPCMDCPLVQKVHGVDGCFSAVWWEEHPVEAARLMGYEVIDDKETNMDNQDSQTGLRVKYDVKKVDTGEVVDKCFVLRPDKDPAAVAALRAYARATPNKALADDIMAWVGASTEDKPRLAEVLGVEEDEPWVYHGIKRPLRIHNGVRQAQFPDGRWGDIDDEVELTMIINHPESIVRLPRLTEPEIAIMRNCGAKWVSRDKGFNDVFLWSDKPKASEDKYEYYLPSKLGDCIASVRAELFPSLKPGDCIELEEGHE